MFEYSVLGCLKGKSFWCSTLEFWVLIILSLGLKHVCGAYDFVKNPEQNLIVMDLLGKFVSR